MRIRSILMLLVCTWMSAFGSVGAAERGPSTPEERAKAITLIQSLETDPMAADARANRQWLMEWITEVPDISVKVCVSLVEPALSKKYPYSGEVGLQPMFSATAFVIQHPSEATNDNAMYLAGLEGALRVYEVLVNSKPDAKLSPLDDLLSIRNRGELAAYVDKVAKKKCKS